MDEKVMNILLDMQKDIKETKEKVTNIEEKEIPEIKAELKETKIANRNTK